MKTMCKCLSVVVSAIIVLCVSGPCAAQAPAQAQTPAYAQSEAEAAMERWVAVVTSAQGGVYIQRTGKTVWDAIKVSEKCYPGDSIRVEENSRAALLFKNDSTLRIDQNSHLTFQPMEEMTVIMRLFRGAACFFSRFPRSLKIFTPHMNGTVKGTEFVIRVDADGTQLTLFEGQVLAENEKGELLVAGGQSVVAKKDQAPDLVTIVKPRDAVHWALYYPAIQDFQPGDFPGESGWQGRARASVEAWRRGDTAGASEALKGLADEGIADGRYLLYRASLALAVGRVDEASAYLDRTLRADPKSANAHALQSVIATTQNDKAAALDLATKAVSLDPQSSAARMSLSYARQARFDIKGAMESTQEAVRLNPSDAHARARLAELWLSRGRLDRALDEAQRAATINPGLGRTQTVLGFAYLTQVKVSESRTAFEKAIALDSADPLARLGLGLAKIRRGDLAAGRQEIEIAASLDVNSSLIRSYLGKAYYEEKRDSLSATQFAAAKQLDPMDPTPWFYDAILKQSVNRPVEALEDIQKSIELNDNRAVYRSKLLLDQDLAARSASLGQIFNNLGFQQLALVEGWKSINTDSTNFSAHRLLADTYSAVPRHGIARVSELLQSQLLQPININPVQPQLAESNLRVFEGAGPVQSAFNEYNPLFNRNRIALQTSGIAGQKNTIGDEVTLNGIYDNVSASIGQLYYKTKGYRPNNDLYREIYNVFAQASVAYQTSIQAEARYSDLRSGELELRFDPNNSLNDLRNGDRTRSIRIGLNHAFNPNLHLILSGIYNRDDGGTDLPSSGYFSSGKYDGYTGEGQVRYRSDIFNVIAGGGYTESRGHTYDKLIYSDPDLGTIQYDSESRDNTYHTNGYLYTMTQLPKNLIWILGISYDRYNAPELEQDQINPKLGAIYTPWEGTTLRAAAFRVLKRPFLQNQTIEPTQVAGFNQFYDEGNGTEFWRYGVAVDQRILRNLFGGVEYSKRDIEVTYLDYLSVPGVALSKQADLDESLFRAYLNWAPHRFLALSVEYQYERFDRGVDFPGVEMLTKLITQRVPLAVNAFLPCGLFAQLKGTYVWQEGDFLDQNLYPTIAFNYGKDSFWVFDAFVGYRLPQRWGAVTVGVKNLFDEGIRFQDTDPANPSITPERFFYARLTLNF